MRFFMYHGIFKIMECDRENVKMCSDTRGTVTFLDLNAFTIPFLNVLHGLMVQEIETEITGNFYPRYFPSQNIQSQGLSVKYLVVFYIFINEI